VTVVHLDSANPPTTGILHVPQSGRGPGVILIQEWWGLVPHIHDVARRLADAGFVALAIDFYRGVETTEPDEAQKLMMGLRVPEAGADLAVGAAYLMAHEAVTSTAVGTIGFCMGGGLSLLAPTVSDQVSAAVAFYPAMPWPDYAPDWSAYRNKSALVHKAESDEPHAGPRIAAYAEEISANGGDITIWDYPGSQHAFFNDDRPEVYSADHSILAWERTIGFLNARLS
jgi:carboxymethylenebutenolidase